MPDASSSRPGSGWRTGRFASITAAAEPRRHRTSSCLALLPMGFTEPDRSPGLLVSSYLTVSPLPAERTPPAVCFLWHFPWPRGRWALPTIAPCGARTFLPPACIERHRMTPRRPPAGDHPVRSSPSRILRRFPRAAPVASKIPSDRVLGLRSLPRPAPPSAGGAGPGSHAGFRACRPGHFS